ncbi:hypothetical protein [Candidatus Thiothrix anitrata]|uniref:AraC family transcriptional regulator n=1 Tax=Candidatus Thiothrix anitrata TaxID=2823902 RepID=A0ABX7X7S2_9GAMM|nr:hypothetical protein [Candidatus Thiothrix anitrata]QTR51228.1 hypothetical protein J8380_06680 [Candidatus Thiothrix anitrata]
MKTNASTLTIPPYFLTTPYNRHNGFSLPDLRFRELWEDTAHTCHVSGYEQP